MAEQPSEVRKLFPLVIDTAEGFHADCPRCEDSEKKLYWNEAKNVGCCFHVDCPWFKDRGGVTERRLRAYFPSHFGISFHPPREIREAEEADLSLPKEFQLLGELPKRQCSEIQDYLGSRGLGKRILERAKVGYCNKGKLWGYIVFPVFNEDGEVVYWQARRYKNRTPKFHNPKSSRKSELIYRIGIAKRPRSIILVESIINVLTLESPSNSSPTRNLILGLLGKSMSSSQLDRVLSHEKWLKEIVVALDGDARREAVGMADQLSGIVPTHIAEIPVGEDINSLGRERSWKLIYSAPLYKPTSRMELLAGVRA